MFKTFCIKQHKHRPHKSNNVWSHNTLKCGTETTAKVRTQQRKQRVDATQRTGMDPKRKQCVDP